MPVFLEEVTLNELRLQGCLLTADDTMRLSIAVLCLPLSQQNAYLFTTFTCQCLRLLHLITESGPNDTLDIFRVVELFLDLSVALYEVFSSYDVTAYMTRANANRTHYISRLR